MQYITLKSAEHIFNSTGADMRYNKPKHEFPLHDHEFHEIVFILNGSANHYINGKVLPMSSGDLFFIRNTDVHTYSDFYGDTFEYYTLLFEIDIVHEMFSFFGLGHREETLLSYELPPSLKLEGAEADIIRSRFSEIFIQMHSDIEKFKTGSRLFLTELISKYFTAENGSSQEIPLWLEYACEKIRLPENFICGTERFFEICGRKREHCTRTMKKHMGITPNEYILELRMNYAASLLSSGYMTVFDVAIECGYNSMPHFHNLFRKHYGISPGEYKKQHNKTI